MAKITNNSPVIVTLMLISSISLILGQIDYNITKVLFTLFGTSWLDPMQYLRMVTYIFGHADYAHFISNILMLLIVGPMIEEKYKSKVLIMMILFTTLISAILQLLFFPNSGLLGMSGIVFMFMILSSFANASKGSIPITFILVVIAYIGNEVYQAIFQHDNISHFAHILGGLCGGLCGFKLRR